jgi:hypothetical protein
VRKLSYEDTLQVLDSWFRRPVTVSILGDGSKWYAATLAGQLPKREDVGLEWLDHDLPDASEGWHFAFSPDYASDKGRLTAGGFRLVRLDFREATLQQDGVLTIHLAGAEMTITPHE